MSRKNQHNPPKHLSAEAKKWWRAVSGGYELESHHLKLLQAAAESWDRMIQARDVLNKDGLTFLDRFGQPKSRPEVSVERDSRTAFQRALRELNLDVESGPVEDSRPPRGARYGGRN